MKIKNPSGIIIFLFKNLKMEEAEFDEMEFEEAEASQGEFPQFFASLGKEGDVIRVFEQEVFF